MDVTSVDQKANGIIPTSHDEVDFVKVQTQTNNFTNNNNCLLNETKGYANFKTDAIQIPKNQNAKVPKDRMSLFSFSKKSTVKPSDLVTEKEEKAQGTTEKSLSCQQPPVPIGTPPRPKKFAKSSSLSRLLGNTYNAKKFEKNEKKLSEGKFNTFGGRRRSNGPYLERFKHYAKEEGDESGGSIISITTPPPPAVAASVPISKTKNEDKSKCDTLDRHLMALEHFQERRTGDLSSKAMRTISRGLGKLWWKRTHSIEISTPDPEFKVSYLGNVLTGWAKGEGCVEKQLNTLWRNYTQNTKPDVIMRLKVCASGLKATTRQHGLTEYWANRITHCCAPKNYPRVFCWIYRHEGRKLKHELRCHAVLCSKEKQVQEICDTLKANLERALREFKREKILKQNARLSLANAVYDNPSLPRRKILLSVGSNNYRPPLERSKSAPKLMAIEEAIGEEGEEAEETNEPEMKPCCQKDSLYPAMTLGRRRCRRGHSIRRTGQARPVSFNLTAGGQQQHSCCNSLGSCKETQTTTDKNSPVTEQTPDEETRIHYGSDDSDDFEKILKHNNYDSNASLANELMPYFESQLHLNSTNSCSLSDLREMHHESEESGPLSLLATINIDPNADPINDFNPNHQTNQIPANDSNTQRPEGKDQEDHFDSVALRRSGVCSDGEDDFLGEEEDDIYFRQAAILNMLHRHSMRKMANLSLSSDEGSSSLETNTGVRDTDHIAAVRYKHQQQSSISSDTSSVSCSMANHQSAGGEVGTPSTAKRNQINNDSADEGSISSGCETASTVTQNQDDLSLQFHHGVAHQLSLPPHPSYTDGDLEISSLESTNLTTEDLYKNLQNRNNSDAATTFSSSSSITLKMDSSPTNSMKDLDTISNDAITENPSSGAGNTANTNRPRRTRRQRDVKPDSDSECSDESGYVEYQEKEKSNSRKLEQPKPQVPIKPQVPPKPMPRRFINTQSKNTTTV